MYFMLPQGKNVRSPDRLFQRMGKDKNTALANPIANKLNMWLHNRLHIMMRFCHMTEPATTVVAKSFPISLIRFFGPVSFAWKSSTILCTRLPWTSL